MKIRFEKLKYQEEAVDAVMDVLTGIETQESLFDLDIASYQQTIDQIDYAFTGEANRISQDEWFKKIAIPNIEKIPVSYTHLTLPTIQRSCRSRWSPYH